MNLQALAQLVPPLHGCTLCAHSMEREGVRHCYAPAVREVFGVQPVNVIRASCWPPTRAAPPGVDFKSRAAGEHGEE